MSKNRIIPQMFDVRPVDETGDLDWKKIESVGPNVKDLQNDFLHKRKKEENEKKNERLQKFQQQRALLEASELARREKYEQKKQESIQREQIIAMLLTQKKQQELENIENQRKKIAEFKKQSFEKIQHTKKEKEAVFVEQRNLENIKRQELVRLAAQKKQEDLKINAQLNRERFLAYEKEALIEKEKLREQEQQAKWLEEKLSQEAKAEEMRDLFEKNKIKKQQEKFDHLQREKNKKNRDSFSWHDIFSPKSFSFKFDVQKSAKAFVFTAIIALLGIGGISYASRGLGMKNKVLGASSDGMASLNLAMSGISHQNFEQSAAQFSNAYASFADGSAQLESMGGILLDATRFVPFATKVSSGKNALEAGKHFSAAGGSLNEIAKILTKLKDGDSQKDISLLDVLNVAQKNISQAKIELDAAQKNIDLVLIDDLPLEKRNKFLVVKQNLPDLRSALDLFLNNNNILSDLLGGNGPRKYLFLFQNNSEMRATGGFIGSYGLLDISNGHIKKFFIDGIFNPDGQLKDKIVPPLPIQKISANWSMHDSNWFADFPVSARKAISFYEKTGGPTADGVITLTPTIMQKLLEITGPIEMPEYDVTLDKDNFIALTQFKVEVDYDKQENKPKKILSDLAPLVLEKLISSRDIVTISKTAQAFLDGLNEKHILFYSENADLEKLISKQGWSGEVLSTSKDYLSVINTNVNGFKTDAVVDEEISHLAEIQNDGSIVDTVTIKRKHNGGNSQYEWLNKVNADYMRVYVPEGAKLLEVSGQTIESSKPRLDYDALGFKRDQDVENEENSIQIDQKSGTRVYQESGKTVFANWVYVSPQESVEITYKYLLPFRMFQVLVNEKEQVDSYSLALQKQSGSIGSLFSSEIRYPADYDVKWNFPDAAKNDGNSTSTQTKLDVDRFVGILFKKK
ncbi:MAG: DUF4012 domain-containing protein [bacterium]